MQPAAFADLCLRKLCERRTPSLPALTQLHEKAPFEKPLKGLFRLPKGLP